MKRLSRLSAGQKQRMRQPRKGWIVEVPISAEGEEAYHNVAGFIEGELSKAALDSNVPEDQRRYVERAAVDVNGKEVVDLLSELPPETRDRLYAAFAKQLEATMHIASATGSKAMKLYHESEKGRVGGKASGEARAVQPWHPPARELAIKSRTVNPRISSTSIAKNISEKVPGAPDPRQVRTFLRLEEEKGVLPPRTR
jgi:hypothetical protein